MYQDFSERVRTMEAENEEGIADLVAQMYEARITNMITLPMHRRLCSVLARRTVDGIE